MKNPSVISFLTTLLLAASLCTHGKELVKDIDGNPLDVDQLYFIQPVKTENFNGGGLCPAPQLPSICPLKVFQAAPYTEPGQPTKFVPKGTTDIETSSPLNIEFLSNFWFCRAHFDHPGLWVVRESSAKECPIDLGARELWSPKSEFEIEKAGDGNVYKLTTPDGIVGSILGEYFPTIKTQQLIVTKDEAKTLHLTFKKVPKADTYTSRVEKLGLRMFPFY